MNQLREQIVTAIEANGFATNTVRGWSEALADAIIADLGMHTGDRLRDRLVLAAINTLAEGDPVLMIGVGDNEIRLGWAHE